MFLTKEEVSQLTGSKIRERQMQWLSSNGYKYEVGLDGTPKILRAYVESRLGFEEKITHTRKPNFSGLIHAAAQKNT